MSSSNPFHVVLTSHPESAFGEIIPVNWGAKTPKQRGPLIGSLSIPEARNTIGSHSGSYTVYRALATAAGTLDPDHKPDLKDTAPFASLGPFPSWKSQKIVSLDPWGADIQRNFGSYLSKGYDIRPTIAITRAHINLPEIHDSLKKGTIKADGKIIRENGEIFVTKAAIDPVWYLPGVAKRFNISEKDLRRILYERTGGMFPELVTRPDLKVLLPPIGGTTVYILGDFKKLGDGKTKTTIRVHDECNGSDVFGSDICTCRPYLVHGIEEAVRSAQDGGLGIIIYCRKEGRSLGEVTKFLVYNARKRQKGGDTAANYFHRTECVAGVQDVRFQELMPDVLHWLGVKTIHRFISMSDMKHDAVVNSGIKILERVTIPDDLVPNDAKVEIEAKKAAGYFTPKEPKKNKKKNLSKVVGRKYK